MSTNNACLDSQQEDEKKSKKKQSPVDDRPTVPAPSEAMLNSEFLIFIIIMIYTTSNFELAGQISRNNCDYLTLH